jgi:hypothetical protein
LLTYGRASDLSVPTELVERGDMVSAKGLGRVGNGTGLSFGPFARGEGGGDVALSSLTPSFHAGGEGTWKRSWPLSSARFA